MAPVNSTTWRQLNTTHQITQVVNDIAEVRGIVIKKAPPPEEVQLSLLGFEAPYMRLIPKSRVRYLFLAMGYKPITPIAR